MIEPWLTVAIVGFSIVHVTLRLDALLGSRMATTNACLYDFNKSCIDVGQVAQFNVIKHFSKNPHLSIINRSETKNILYTIDRHIN